MLVITDFL